jgi:predicted DCC family thiol-disulfide oxidoreductase YuxK
MSWWERVWFAPARPLGLIVVRWLVLGTVIVDVIRSWGAISAVPRQAELLWEPVSLLAAAQVPPVTPAMMTAAALIAITGCALSLARVLPRLTGLTGAAGYAFFAMAENSLGKVSHGLQPAVVMAFVVAFAAAPAIRDEASWRFRWPVQLARFAMAGMLFAAAWTKLTVSGLNWVTGDNLRNMLVADAMLHRAPALQDLSLWIASEPYRWHLAAAGALVGEATLIVALFVRAQPLRALLVINGVGTVVGISLLVDLVGFPIVGLGLAMLDVERLSEVWHDAFARVRWFVIAGGAGIVLAATMYLHTPNWLVTVPVLLALAVLAVLAPRARHATAPAAATLIYDADCDFCTRFAEWAAATGRLTATPWQDADLDALGLTAEMCTGRAYWVRDGRVLGGGADAIGHALIARGGRVRPAGEIILCPPVSLAARAVYAVVARNRHRMPGGTEACAVPAHRS